jgi:hypothetical protein
MLLAECFVLLLLDPESGEFNAPHRKADLDVLCAAGLLIELISQQRLRPQGNRLIASGSLPASHPLLSQAHGAVGQQAQPAAHCLAHLVKLQSPLPQQLCDGLYRRDVLHRERRFRLFGGSIPRYRLRSHQARNETIALLHAATQRPQERIAHIGLLMMMDLAGALTRFFSAAEHGPAIEQILDLGTQRQDDENLRAVALLRDGLIDV